ncbi:MAG: hypothetical protein H0U67_02640 [Gemmatimonadetes bacterium]|nr:hypothetical protein [Gemmatimonadota bacterium]
MEERRIRIPLSPQAQTAFSKPIVGRGGHQTLLRRLQGQIQDGVLEISSADMEKMLRYMLSYGSGGFQQRFAAAAGRKTARKKR